MMKCHQMGLIDPDEPREMSHKLVSEMLTKTPTPEFSLVIDSYWQVWKSIDTQIKKIEQKLREQAFPNEPYELKNSKRLSLVQTLFHPNSH